MKLVIDIPDKIYKVMTETAIMVTEVYPSTIEKALAEGTPYEERKAGKWHYYRCSECKSLCTYFLRGSYMIDIEKRPNYCPNCGAKMEEE